MFTDSLMSSRKARKLILGQCRNTNFWTSPGLESHATAWLCPGKPVNFVYCLIDVDVFFVQVGAQKSPLGVQKIPLLHRNTATRTLTSYARNLAQPSRLPILTTVTEAAGAAV